MSQTALQREHDECLFDGQLVTHGFNTTTVTSKAIYLTCMDNLAGVNQVCTVFVIKSTGKGPLSAGWSCGRMFIIGREIPFKNCDQLIKSFDRKL